MKIHHIGIVVKNIQESLGEFSKFVKFDETSIPTLVGSQKVNVCFIKIGEFWRTVANNKRIFEHKSCKSTNVFDES